MLSALAVVIHVLMVFWLVAGILGRDTVYRQAARTTDLAKLRHYVELGGIFELRMVRPATSAVFIAGLIAAWARGWPILGFLQGGTVNWVLTAIVIYLSIVGREPTLSEEKLAQQLFQTTKSAKKGNNDLIWVLLNIPEFLFIQ